MFMNKLLLLATAIVFGLPLNSSAQLTNQVAVTPLINITLLERSNTAGTNRFNSGDEILFMVSAVDGKGHGFAVLRPEQSFIFELHDAKGNLIKKTDLGMQNSQPLDIAKIISRIKDEHPFGLTDQQLKDYLPIYLKIRHQGVRGQLNYLFVPDKYFAIPEKGIYTLDLQIRAWVQKTNNQYGVVVSPPLRVEVENK
jgi:hypothetical protein